MISAFRSRSASWPTTCSGITGRIRWKWWGTQAATACSMRVWSSKCRQRPSQILPARRNRMTTREELIREHVIHEFDRALAVRNITGCYGALCAQFYRHLLGHVKGRRVLDVGCGLGLFGSTAAQQGFQVHSIDIDERSLEIARELFGPAYHQE
ncbi:MAG: methyltransferase domain-containing protein, partial [Betaproteobacteria bacterium]|nr:methyltransferase domain-containing protein [Betaproteobacteria bacterium]